MKRIPSLDGFRAISIILVLIAHSRLSTGFPARYEDLARHGAVGVTVFFVISGFLITWLLLTEQKNKGYINLKRFYINRCFRILPVFLLYTLFVFYWNHKENIDLKNTDLLHVLTFTVNFQEDRNWYTGHFWTLSIEEQFYIFWPVILILFNKHLKTTLYLLIIYSCISRVIAYKFSVIAIITLTPFFNYSDAIFVGALGGIIFFENPVICKKTIFNSYPAQLLAVFLICVFVYCSGYGKLAKVALPFGNLIISTSILFLLFSYIRPSNSIVYKFLNSRFIVHIGILSYSIYIWQQFFVVGKYGWRIFPLSILVIYVVSLISYYLWEKSFLTMKKKTLLPDLISVIETFN